MSCVFLPISSMLVSPGFILHGLLTCDCILLIFLPFSMSDRTLYFDICDKFLWNIDSRYHCNQNLSVKSLFFKCLFFARDYRFCMSQDFIISIDWEWDVDFSFTFSAVLQYRSLVKLLWNWLPILSLRGKHVVKADMVS